ncbi:MAG TPA: hypothetical protein VIV40_15045 [Kofleriaceae bacterium]
MGALIATAALGCRRDSTPDIDYKAAPVTTTDTTKPKTYQAQTVGIGTSASYGAGAVGGAAIATQPTLAIEIDANDMAVTRDTPAAERARQGRNATTRTRATNPDSEHQAIGGGDTYDRNR